MIKFSIKVKNMQESSLAQDELFERNYRWNSKVLRKKIEFYRFSNIKNDIFIHCFDDGTMRWSKSQLKNEKVIEYKDLSYILPKPITDNIQDSLR